MLLRKTAIPFLLVLTLLIAACATPSGPAGEDLSGVWTLTALNGQEPLAGSTVTARFENGEVGGQAGCNSYGGQYSLDGQQLSVSALFQTEMACMEPEGVMDQESVFLQTLSQAASFSITGDQLEIQNAASETVLTFSKSQ
jgi:heat shock protein HslJ